MPFGRGFGYGAGYGGGWSGRCWRYPWMPRGWASGAYGPFRWTSEGPEPIGTNTEEQVSVLKAEKQSLETEMEFMKKALSELEEKIKKLEESK
ncbi:MAG: DUF5320 domain-containing protein [Candidatus Diapherotrites archaeon]|nr:DUF5320 domain-containing protein [Candidatus Diapherotrites archaeon]